MRALVWFRADLRVRDNAALAEACRRASRGVVAAFALCPRAWQEHDWGPVRVDFVLRSLAGLRDALERLRIPLKVVAPLSFDAVPDALLELAERCACDELHFNREYEVNEARRDAAVTARFLRSGRAVHAHTDQVILPPAAVRTGSGGFYKKFTPYRRRWLEVFRETGGVELLDPPPRQADTGIAADAVPAAGDEEVADFAFDDCRPVREGLWRAGEEHAAARLEAFVEERLGRYAEDRDLPAVDGTSALSPYLASGVLGPRQCLAAALAANQNRVDSGSKGAVTWITELIWREFYRHVLVGFPRVCMHRPFQLATDKIRWSRAEAAFEAWCEGLTGFPIVDAGMRQLAGTGWMHNRLRMIVAMFLTKDLLIDWRRGERHFMRHLVDGDLASNNGGWQWAASTGTDAQPYFRVFNPTGQGRKFDPDGEFVRRHVPELAELEGAAVHEPWKSDLELDYPAPIVDHGEARERAIAAFKGL